MLEETVLEALFTQTLRLAQHPGHEPDAGLDRHARGGLNESFTVRKISYGEGVERVFPVHSPMIDSIKVARRGKVRRAKLYYLRDRRGKSARIVERTDRYKAKDTPAGAPAAAE